MTDVDADIAVIGAGPAGLAAALALVAEGARVIVAAPAFAVERAAADTRTIALMGPSVDLFRNLGVWNAIEPHATAITAIRLIDARGGLLRAPETVFRASETGRAAFGANVPVARLVAALDGAARGCAASLLEADPSPDLADANRAAAQYSGAPARRTRLGRDLPSGIPHQRRGDASSIEMLDGTVADIRPGADTIEIGMAAGARRRVRLVVGADGRGSAARAAAGIGAETWVYNQAAVTAAFEHARPHEGVSTEFHHACGPLTTVPAGDRRSGLVWVETPARAAALAGLDGLAFAAELERQLAGLLGRVGAVGPRALFPLGGLAASSMGAKRIALVGEAAHALPPIGAQGFNLSLRDVAWLAEIAGRAIQAGGDPGRPDVLAAYGQARRADVVERTTGVHWLNQVLLLDAFAIQTARGLGLHVLANSPAARRQAIERGLAPAGPLPQLMRGWV